MSDSWTIANVVDELRDEHALVRGLLDEHQEALVDREGWQAGESFDALCEALTRHMRREEELLLAGLNPPADSGRIGVDPALYRVEHRRIADMLRDLATRVVAVAHGASPAARYIIDLLDEERTLKNLLDHHFSREEQYLYPYCQGISQGPGSTKGGWAVPPPFPEHSPRHDCPANGSHGLPPQAPRGCARSHSHAL